MVVAIIALVILVGLFIAVSVLTAVVRASRGAGSGSRRRTTGGGGGAGEGQLVGRGSGGLQQFR